MPKKISAATTFYLRGATIKPIMCAIAPMKNNSRVQIRPQRAMINANSLAAFVASCVGLF